MVRPDDVTECYTTIVVRSPFNRGHGIHFKLESSFLPTPQPLKDFDMISRIILGCYLYVVVVAKPLTRLLTVHEALSSVPSSFVHSGPADADSVLKLRVVLVQRNPSGLIDALYNVSTPSSTSYGLHLTKEEVRQDSYLFDSPSLTDYLLGRAVY